MPGINNTSLGSSSQADVDAVTTSTIPEDMLLTAVTTTGTSRSFTVETESNLPDLLTTQISDGQIVYVKSIKMHVIASKGRWLSLDGRLFSRDFFGGELYSWGLNLSGQLGDNTTTSKRSPVSVVGGFTDWCRSGVGGYQGFGIRTNGTLWSWGCNNVGQLGDNTTTSKSSPVSVVGGFTGSYITGGINHIIALRSNGTIWTWGCNNRGQLGTNNTTDRSSPVSVIGGFTDWRQISGGSEHSFGLRTNGTIWGWGENGVGNLGDNTTSRRSSPVSLVGGFTDWCQVSGGNSHGIGLRTNGTLWTWGFNLQGQLGDNTTTSKSSPVSVVGGFTDWCQVNAGSQHNVAIRTNGTLWTWGCNNYGQLGDNTTTSKSSPVSVVGGFTDWCQVSAGMFTHNVGIRTNGTMWSWGYNQGGRLGDNTITGRSSPVSVVGGFTDWCQVSVGRLHSIAIRKF